MLKKKAKFDDAMAEMEERICRQFCHHGRPQCGIVYCLSRNDCEKVAAELQARLAARLGHRTRVRYPNLAPSPAGIQVSGIEGAQLSGPDVCISLSPGCDR